MTRVKNRVINLNSALLQPGKTANASQSDHQVRSDIPTREMPLVLTLDEVVPFPDNPRTSPNPKYQEIKASIRARGLDTVPKVTCDPERPELGYFFSDGGNTRYAILSELWQETGDERFYRFSCVFKPWPGRISCVIGHLAENEVRGDLSFIEKALGIRQARRLYEQQRETSVTLREFSSLLAEEGYPIHYSTISRMEDTVKYLYPYMPALLVSGFGSPQIRQLLALRRDAGNTWRSFAAQLEMSVDFAELFASVCQRFDDPDLYCLEMFRDELIGVLVNALPHPLLNYDRWLLELDPNHRRQQEFPDQSPTYPLPTGASVTPELFDDDSEITTDVTQQPTDEPEQLKPVVSPAPETAAPPEREKERVTTVARNTDVVEYAPMIDTEAGEIAVMPEIDRASEIAFASIGLEPVSTLWAIPSLQDDIEHLQAMAFRLAFELADSQGCAVQITRSPPSRQGAGYAASTEISSPFIQLLLAIADGAVNGTTTCSLSEAVIGSGYPTELPLLNDIYCVKLLRLIRVLRRLREQQRAELLIEKEDHHE